MFAIYKRDLLSYFTTPVGYVFMAIFLAVNGGLFSLMTLQMGASSSYQSYFSMLLLLLAVVIPVLTMKSFAEEKKQKTEQLLLTAPISIGKIVMGKFLSIYTIFAGTFLVGTVLNFAVYHKFATGLYSWVVEDAVREGALTKADVFWPFFFSFFGPAIAVLLLGAALIAVGIFVSAMTENQLVSLILSIAFMVLLIMFGSINSIIPFAPMREALNWLSVYTRFNLFLYGIFDYSALLYYASISFIFLFLTVRLYEKRRWA